MHASITWRAVSTSPPSFINKPVAFDSSAKVPIFFDSAIITGSQIVYAIALLETIADSAMAIR
ncbi:hypothetical protein EOS_17755 [Caballeronia mineralivorans PML1(12)]|uniref:Uncharacterized protein n=1 Tax=Caballeronia mineralivorans PML1(12) TaxID=908627 RepID=A0A0J1CW96_9BURK|nr:hypothetical protein EOS_17755 [Caballeronia mineralivorans PML1(12)]